MKNLLFTKSAGLIDSALEGAGVAPKPAPEAPSANPTSSSDSLGDWFSKNRGKIGIGLTGLGSGMILSAYIMQKEHEKEIKRLKREYEKQKEENNKTE